MAELESKTKIASENESSSISLPLPLSSLSTISPSAPPSSRSSVSSFESLNSSENIWSHILKKSTRKIRDNNGTIILLGDSHSGKSSLITKFSDRIYHHNVAADGAIGTTAAVAAATGTSNLIGHYIVDYCYLLAKNKQSSDKDEVLSHVNVWTVDEPSHLSHIIPQLFQKSSNNPPSQGQKTSNSSAPSSSSSTTTNANTPSPAPIGPIDISALESTLFIICFDISEPWKIQKSLLKWTAALQSLMTVLFSKLPVAEESRLKGNISKIIQSYYAGAAALNSPDFQLNTSIPKLNLGIPLLFVGTKGDQFSRYQGVKSAGLEEKFEFLIRKIRRLAVDYGAGVFVCSAAGKGVNVELLQSYIYHRLYAFPLPPSVQPKAVGASDNEEFSIFIPNGFDSIDLIDSSLPLASRTGWTDETPLEEVFKLAEKSSKKTISATVDRATVSALDNSKFFKNLKNQLESSANIVGASANATAVLNNLQAKASYSQLKARAAAGATNDKSTPVSTSSIPTPSPSTTAPLPSPTSAAAPSSATKSSNAAAASAASNVSGSKAKTSTTNAAANPMKGQIAVKQFFRSLLNNNPKMDNAAAGGAAAAAAGATGAAGGRRSSQDKGTAEQNDK